MNKLNLPLIGFISTKVVKIAHQSSPTSKCNRRAIFIIKTNIFVHVSFTQK